MGRGEGKGRQFGRGQEIGARGGGGGEGEDKDRLRDRGRGNDKSVVQSSSVLHSATTTAVVFKRIVCSRLSSACSRRRSAH